MASTPKNKRPSSRKKRIDSAAEKAKIIQAATRQFQIPPSVQMGPVGEAFFQEILEEAPKAHWSKHKLSFAAQLASIMELLEGMKAEVAERGALMVVERVVGRGENQQVIDAIEKNPLLGEITKMSATVVAMRRSLALHARGETGDNREAGKRKELGKQIEQGAMVGQAQGAGQDEDDGLIMRPN